MISGFVRGDRIPDFRRLNPAGEPVMLYDLQKGGPVLLLAVANPDAAAACQILFALSDRDSQWARFTRVALVRGNATQCQALSTSNATGVTLLADDGSVMHALLGTEGAGTQASITLFALDANLRIIERLEHRAGEDAAAFLRRLAGVYADLPEPAPEVKSQQAPALLIPRVFDRDLCEGLIAYFEEQGGTPSGTAYVEGDKAYWRVDPEVKMRRDVYVREGVWLERIKELLVRRVLPEIARCFNYRVTQHEIFKLACYEAETGGYFRPHRDNESRDTQHRRFAMTLNLNTGDYDGGQLRLPEFGPHLYQPGRGDAIVFSSSLLHEVVPVTRGKRYVLIGFFFGEDQKMAAVEYVSGTDIRA